jgi:hypothetical protein
MLDDIDWEDVEDSEEYGVEVAKALQNLQGEQKEKFKEMIRSGKWVEALEAAGRPQPARFIPPVQPPPQPVITPEQAHYQAWEREQGQLQKGLEYELKQNTQGYIGRLATRNKYNNLGLRQPYQPPQTATNEDLMASYRRDLEKAMDMGSEAVRLLRARYRQRGLKI